MAEIIIPLTDPALLEVLRLNQLPLELCVTSNVCTRCCATIQQHPIRAYFDAGLMVSINSDDPPMFGTTLLDEYELVQQQFHFSDDDMVTFARNSILSSFLSPTKKAALVKELDDFSRMKTSPALANDKVPLE